MEQHWEIDESTKARFLELCKLAAEKANQLGGKKYHTKNFGGGLVFQSYNTGRLKDLIVESSKSNYKK